MSDYRTLLLLWLGGFLIGLAIAIFAFRGFDLSALLFGGCGGVLSGLALRTIFGELP
jgi:hypothetical protein